MAEVLPSLLFSVMLDWLRGNVLQQVYALDVLKYQMRPKLLVREVIKSLNDVRMVESLYEVELLAFDVTDLVLISSGHLYNVTGLRLLLQRRLLEEEVVYFFVGLI